MQAANGSDIVGRGSFEHPLKCVAQHLLAQGAKPPFHNVSKLMHSAHGSNPSCQILRQLTRHRACARLAQKPFAIDRKTIGEDIKTVQLGWPLGMPLVGHLGAVCGRSGRSWTIALHGC